MKCEEVQLKLSALTANELAANVRQQVQDHLADCAACRELLLFHRELDDRLDGVAEVPMQLRSRVDAEIGKPSWWGSLRGQRIMRNIALSAATAATVTALVMLAPRQASASTPQETFERMGFAIAQVAQEGGLKLKVKADGTGTINVRAFLDGKELPTSFPIVTEVQREGDVLKVHLKVDFDPSSYADIRFGEDQNTLELVRKGRETERAVVKINPKSARPTSWASQMQQGRQANAKPSKANWKTTGEAKLSSKFSDAILVEGFPLFYKLDVNVTMHLNQEATVEVKPTVN